MKLKFKTHGQQGLLITFCGLDGCGKTTIINMLNKELEILGYKTFLTKQPTKFVRESPIWRTYMDQPEHDEFDYRSLSLLAASDRVQHGNKVIMPKLCEGNIVISDRYFYSCLANLRARGYRNDMWIYEISESIPRPDIAFFLDVDVELSLNRVRSRESEKDKWIDIPLQYELRNEYLNICNKNNGILINSSGEAHVTFDEVFKNVYSYIQSKSEMKNG